VGLRHPVCIFSQPNKRATPSLSFSCNTLRHNATHCNTLQYTATHCNTLLFVFAFLSLSCNTLQHCNTLKHTATHFYSCLRFSFSPALQHTATHCNMQHTSIGYTYICIYICIYIYILHFSLSPEAKCNKLQHIATHCTTLQHTATHFYPCSCFSLSHAFAHTISLSRTREGGGERHLVSNTHTILVSPCSVLQCVAACRNELQCVAVCCSVLQCVAVCYIVLQCVAACGSMFQRVVVCCSVLQWCILVSPCNALNIKRCITLQHTATYCNILQYTAHCNTPRTVRDAPMENIFPDSCFTGKSILPMM